MAGQEEGGRLFSIVSATPNQYSDWICGLCLIKHANIPCACNGEPRAGHTWVEGRRLGAKGKRRSRHRDGRAGTGNVHNETIFFMFYSTNLGDIVPRIGP